MLPQMTQLIASVCARSRQGVFDMIFSEKGVKMVVKYISYNLTCTKYIDIIWLEIFSKSPPKIENLLRLIPREKHGLRSKTS
jgi:hypothetical protein